MFLVLTKILLQVFDFSDFLTVWMVFDLDVVNLQSRLWCTRYTGLKILRLQWARRCAGFWVVRFKTMRRIICRTKNLWKLELLIEYSLRTVIILIHERRRPMLDLECGLHLWIGRQVQGFVWRRISNMTAEDRTNGTYHWVVCLKLSAPSASFSYGSWYSLLALLTQIQKVRAMLRPSDTHDISQILLGSALLLSAPPHPWRSVYKLVHGWQIFWRSSLCHISHMCVSLWFCNAVSFPPSPFERYKPK